MKKLFFTLCFLLILSMSFAQIPNEIGFNDHYSSRNNFGFKAGFNLSNIYGKYVSDTKLKFGFNGGIFYNFPVNKSFSIQPELLFSMKGYSNEKYSKYTEEYYYIEIPVLGKKTISFNRVSEISFYVGPSVAFNIGATLYHDGEIYNVIEQMSILNISIIPGIILEFNNKYSFEFRYSLGLTNVFNDCDHVGSYALTFMVGYII